MSERDGVKRLLVDLELRLDGIALSRRSIDKQEFQILQDLAFWQHRYDELSDDDGEDISA